MKTRLILMTFVAVLMAVLCAAPAMRADALHGFCTTVTCSDNGAITPVGTGTFTFGFYDAGGPATGDDVLVFLSPISLGSFSVGETNTGSASGTPSLFGTNWTTGQLDTLLGLSASPTNPFGAYGGLTGLDPGVSTFFVYTLDLGQQTLNDQAGKLNNPLFSVSGLPEGVFILDFLETGDGTIGTANSAALQIVGPPPSVPEPRTMTLLGAGLLGVFGLSMLRRRQQVGSV